MCQQYHLRVTVRNLQLWGKFPFLAALWCLYFLHRCSDRGVCCAGLNGYLEETITELVVCFEFWTWECTVISYVCKTLDICNRELAFFPGCPGEQTEQPNQDLNSQTFDQETTFTITFSIK